MPFSLGVDIGSTYTAAGLWRDGSVQSVPLGNRSNAVPSVLFLREDGTLLVGEAAARRAVVEPDRQARDFKRRMGDDVPVLLGDDHRMSAQELTGHLLRWVVGTVAEREGERPAHVVLTHPAEWGEYRRGLLVEAAATAGLPDVGLLPEPVAAAAWYAAQDRVAPGALVGVYDLGGGTFDASVVRKTDTGFEVFGEPGGDETIGGLNFDHTLLRYVAAAAGVDLGGLDDNDPAIAAALAQFRDAVVDAKEALSADTEATVPVLLPGLTRHVTLSRSQVETLIRPQILSTVQLFAQIVNRAGAEPEALHGVLLVGGSSRIPLVAQLLRSELGARVAVDAHPKYAVSLGAAITAAPHVAPAVRTAPTVPDWARPTVEVPSLDPTRTQELRPVPPKPEVVDAPTVVHPVNPVVTGLTAPTDVTVPVPPRPHLPRPPVTARDEPPVVVRTGGEGGGYWGRGVTAAAVGVVVVLAVVAVIAVLTLGGPRSGGTVTRPPASNGPSASASALPAATVAGALVTDPPGTDTMSAVTALPGGDLVAVGHSVDLHPRAWLRHGTAWRAVAVPTAGTAVVADVAAAGGRVVAVGFELTGTTERPAVWTSTNGDGWKSAALSGDLRADGLRVMTAVVAARGGGFLATAEDFKADQNGDAAVFRSTDGTQWQRVRATGLDGTGTQMVYRMAGGPDGYVAIGATLTGASLGPAVWTSPDGVQWQASAARLPGSATLWAVARVAGGTLLICAAVGSVDEPKAGCWTQRGTDDWRALSVTGSPTPRYIYGLVPTPAGVIAVGEGRDGTTADAAAWLLTLPPG